MNFLDVIALVFLFLHFFDRLFYWLVAERDWKRSNQELHTQIEVLSKQSGGLVTLIEDFKAREKRFGEEYAKLKADNDFLRKNQASGQPAN